MDEFNSKIVITTLKPVVDILKTNNIEYRFLGSVVEATTYKLRGIEFVGIPKRASATGVKSSETNPKRKKELILLKERGIQPFTNNYIHISIFGIRADWLYHLSMAMLNIIGAIRVRLGLAFDPWR